MGAQRAAKRPQETFRNQLISMTRYPLYSLPSFIPSLLSSLPARRWYGEYEQHAVLRSCYALWEQVWQRSDD